jgi:hypothetical protein
MSVSPPPWEGACRCGAVRIRISAQPFLTMACHCTGCQKMSASAFSLSVGVPAEAFEVTAGEPVLGGLNRDMHHFCPQCLSWMFTRPVGMDWFVNVRSTMLDERHWSTPFVETYTSEKLPWAATPAVHSYETIPSMDEYPRLMDEFQQQLAADG